jgi:hypothetical protein
MISRENMVVQVYKDKMFIVGGLLLIENKRFTGSKLMLTYLKIKRWMEVCFAIIALILFLPVFVLLALGVRLSSKGEIFYSQVRIGRFGKSFRIYKFRSMYSNAEYELTDIPSQSRETTRGYLRTVDGSNSMMINNEAVARIKINLEKKGNEYQKTLDFLRECRRQYLEIKDKYEKSLAEYQKEFTYVNIITNPKIADKKCSPYRSLIVLGSLISTFIFTLLIISFYYPQIS